MGALKPRAASSATEAKPCKLMYRRPRAAQVLQVPWGKAATRRTAGWRMAGGNYAAKPCCCNCLMPECGLGVLSPMLMMCSYMLGKLGPRGTVSCVWETVRVLRVVMAPEGSG